MATTQTERCFRLLMRDPGDSRYIFAWLSTQETVFPPEEIPAFRDDGDDGEVREVVISSAAVAGLEPV